MTFSGAGTLLLSNYKSALLELKSRDNCQGLASSVASLANFEKAYTSYELYRNSKLEKENKAMREEMSQLRQDMKSYFGFGGTAIKGIGQSTVSALTSE